QPGNRELADARSEAAFVRHLLPQATEELALRFNAIIAYEEFCAIIEDSFDRLRYLSSQSGGRALDPSEFTEAPENVKAAGELKEYLEKARQALAQAPRQTWQEFSEL